MEMQQHAYMYAGMEGIMFVCSLHWRRNKVKLLQTYLFTYNLLFI